MVEAGATATLLELTLMGTVKRGSRIMEILRADKGKQVADAAPPGSRGYGGRGHRHGIWTREQQQLHRL